jgi:hypothetical protein
MRHKNIKTTMDYYANVDAAVEAAVFGKQRNSSRNRRAFREREAAKLRDATDAI